MVKSITINCDDRTIKTIGCLRLSGKVNLRRGNYDDIPKSELLVGNRVSGGVIGGSGSACETFNYSDFLVRKRAAMLYGGSMMCGDVELFNFTSGLFGAYFFKDGTQYLRSFCGKTPTDGGAVMVLPGRFLNIRSNDVGVIEIRRSSELFSPNTYYMILHKIEARLYRAVNWLIERFFVYDLSRQRDGRDPSNNRAGLGPLLGTLLHLQANITRYNHKVWESTFHTSVSSYSGAAALSVGFTNIDCMLSGLSIEVDISYNGIVDRDGEPLNISGDEIDKLPPIFTLYAMGEDSGIIKNDPKVSVSLFRNGSYCDGTGYDSEDELHSARISINITGTPAFRSGQHFFAAFAITVPVGTELTFIPQDISNPFDEEDSPIYLGAYHEYTITTTWVVSNYPEQSYTRTEKVAVYASRFIEPPKDEDEEETE